MSQDVCQVTIIDEERILQARDAMPEPDLLFKVAEIFKLLGEPTRVRILQALSTTELCVCDLAVLLEMTSSAVSHQLRLLRAKDIVRYRKEGKIVYYSLVDEHVRALVCESLVHVREN